MGSAESTLLSNAVGTGNGDMPPWVLTIFEFSDWKTRARLMMTSKRWWHNCNDSSFYRFLAQRLTIEHGIYIPPVLPASETWKSLFTDAFRLRYLWSPNEQEILSLTTNKNGVGERFKISVFARFCPPRASAKKQKEDSAVEGSVNSADEEIEVTLPLYQRLALIRMSRNLKSTKQALKVLASEGGWFKERWNSVGNKENLSAENVNHVASRGGATFDADQDVSDFALKLRAKHDREAAQAQKNGKRNGPGADSAGANDATRMVAAVQTVDPVSGRVVMVAPEVGLREFRFDSVLHAKASQKSMYDAAARRLVMDFLNGFNSTAIVYGQTGSGKTFSMFGAHATSTTHTGADSAHTHTHSVYTTAAMREGRGIVPRACEEIFAAAEQRRRECGIDSEISVSYVEVFGDEVSDLLKHGARCGHSKVAAQQYVLSGAAERVVLSMRDVEEVLEIGESQKRRAATHMNERSTRAHSLFIMTLKQTRPDTTVTLRSRLFLADLGGSEQVKKSGVEAGVLREGGNETFSLGFEMGQHMREAVNINLGLLALKKCIEALNNRALYTPYQDSKLTKLLSAGLGGNSKTSIIVCANMDPVHASETVATLRFGEKCALIETEARNNATMLAGVLAALDAQIAALEAEIARKERWEQRDEVREDTLAEEGTYEKAMGAVETKKVYMLVGAEEERRQLGELLIRRAKFIGCDPEDDGEGDGLDTPTAGVKAGGARDGVGKGRSSKRVVGFGREYAELYGFGGKFDETAEEQSENARFARAITDEAALPMAVRAHKGTKSWATGAPIEETDAAALERKAQRVRRNRLAYSGISA